VTTILNYITLAAVLLIVSPRSVSAQASGPTTCQLNDTNNGKEVSVRGTVANSPHDFIFAVSGCKDVLVLEFSEIKGRLISTHEGSKNLAKFERFSRVQGKCPHGKRCGDRPAYKVDAILIGRLEVGSVPDGYWEDGLGYLHDHSGKITGKFGFGHPPVYKYRLTVMAVSKVVVRRRHW
jgi:hypothetical protein